MTQGRVRALKAFGLEALFQLAPPLAVALGNRKIAPPEAARLAQWRSLPLETLRSVISDEWERAKALDEKLVKTTAALSISGAIGGAAARPLLDGLASSPAKSVVFACLLFAIISLFSGVVMGFAGLRPKARGGIGPDFAVKTLKDDAAARTSCVEALAGFEVSNMRRANEASGANTAIRNGILAFVLATLIGLFAPRAPPPAPAAPPNATASVHIDVSTAIVAPASTAAGTDQPTAAR